MKTFWLPVFGFVLAATLLAEEPPSDQGRFPIEERLRDDDPEVIRRALFELKHDKKERLPSVKSQLIDLCRHTSPDVRYDAIDILEEIGRPAVGALPALKENLKHSEARIRIAAASAVWSVAGQAKVAVPVLVTELRGDDADEESRDANWHRETAEFFLREIGPDASFSLDDIANLLEDRRVFVRFRAANVLGSLGPRLREQVEPRLSAALHDPEGKVRVAAARGLVDVDASLDEVIPILIALAAQEVPATSFTQNGVFAESSMEGRAVLALGRCEGDAAPAVETLAKLLDSHVLALRLESAKTLGLIGPAAADAIPALSKAMRDTYQHSFAFAHNSWSVGDNAATALELIGIPAAPTLVEALNDKEPIVRARAAHALGGIPDAASQTVGPLIESLGDSEASVRIAAAKSLGRVGSPAVSAAPALVKLLQDDQDAVFFRENMDSVTETVCEVAYRALVAINPPAQQVVPALVSTFKDAEQISFEQLALLSRYASQAAAAKAPLEQLLEIPDRRLTVASAYGLAMIEPNHPKIERILTDAVLARQDDHFFASRGLLQLASAGKTFDMKTRSQLLEIAEADDNSFLWAVLLRQSPNDEGTPARLLDAVDSARWLVVRDVSEPLRTVRDLVHHPAVEDTLLRQLEFVVEDADTGDYFDRMHRREWQEETRFRAAKILIEAGLHVNEAVECLRDLAESRSPALLGKIADLLAGVPKTSPQAISILTALLANKNEFLAREGPRPRSMWLAVRDLAARALVKLEARVALEGQLNHSDAAVRTRVVRALGLLEKKSITPGLLACAHDLDHHVRREAMWTLGRIGDEHPDVRPELLELLRAAQHDRRRTVRDEADRVLARWNHP